MKIRVFAIINLCIIFWMAVWYIGYPFLKEHYDYRSRSLIYKQVMEEDPLYTKLPFEIQKKIRDDYHILQEKFHRGWWNKSIDGVYIIGFGLPSFLRAWLFFGLLISILLLYRSQGVKNIVWILPVLSMLYLFDNHYFGKNPPRPSDHSLYPTEEYLVQNYVDKEGNIALKDLKEGWNRYLVTEWIGEPISANFIEQVTRGNHAFQVARLECFGKEESASYDEMFSERRPLPFLLLFVGWNLLFYIVVARNFYKEHSLISTSHVTS